MKLFKTLEQISIYFVISVFVEIILAVFFSFLLQEGIDKVTRHIWFYPFYFGIAIPASTLFYEWLEN